VNVRELAKVLSRIRGERRDKRVIFQSPPDGGFEPLMETADIVTTKENTETVVLLAHFPPEPQDKKEGLE
jgi:hypothetical protein